MDADDFGGRHSSFDSFEMLGMMGPMVSILMFYMVLSTVIVPLVLYIIARWREHREQVPDQQMGLKFALGYFKWQGFQIALLGAAALLWSVVSSLPSEAHEYIYRPAFGLILPGLLVFGVSSWALLRTNQIERPQVGRLLAGYTMVLIGVFAFTFLVIGFVLLFWKGSTNKELGRFVWSFVFVYGAAWVTQTAMFMVDVAPSQPPVQPPPT
jgi:hypothetical protein